MRAITLTVYSGLDNTESIVLAEKQEGKEEKPHTDLSGVTRVLLNFADTDFDSDVLGSGAIWSTDKVEYPPYSARYIDMVSFRLGSAVEAAGIAAGEYDATLTIFDATYTSGRCFSFNGMTVEVI